MAKMIKVERCSCCPAINYGDGVERHCEIEGFAITSGGIHPDCPLDDVPTPKVKALEWKKNGDCGWLAQTKFGFYAISASSPGYFEISGPNERPVVVGPDTLSNLFDMFRKDFKRRVMACLEEG